MLLLVLVYVIVDVAAGIIVSIPSLLLWRVLVLGVLDVLFLGAMVRWDGYMRLAACSVWRAARGGWGRRAGARVARGHGRLILARAGRRRAVAAGRHARAGVRWVVVVVVVVTEAAQAAAARGPVRCGRQ